MGESVAAYSPEDLGRNLVAGTVTVMSRLTHGSTVSTFAKGALDIGKSVVVVTGSEGVIFASEMLRSFAELTSPRAVDGKINLRQKNRLNLAGDELAESDMTVVRDIGSFRQLRTISNAHFRGKRDGVIILDHHPYLVKVGPGELQRERDADFIQRLRFEVAEALGAGVLVIPGHSRPANQDFFESVIN